MFGPGDLPSIMNLQCFVAAAEHLNFRRAASQLSLTPTAFGQRIKQLGHNQLAKIQSSEITLINNLVSIFKFLARELIVVLDHKK